jgi:hypothetical protein
MEVFWWRSQKSKSKVVSLETLSKGKSGFEVRPKNRSSETYCQTDQVESLSKGRSSFLPLKSKAFFSSSSSPLLPHRHGLRVLPFKMELDCIVLPSFSLGTMPNPLLLTVVVVVLLVMMKRDRKQTQQQIVLMSTAM